MAEPRFVTKLKEELYELHHEFSWLRNEGIGPSGWQIEYRDQLMKKIWDYGYEPLDFEPPRNWKCPHV